jgi:aspartoacylase
MNQPWRVVIVGGTHGNEWTGVKIVRHYQEHLKNKFPQLDLEFIFANPIAHEMNSRFVGEDLNRAFQFLNETRNTYENTRAREIKEIIQRAPCLVLDLHTTTANMGNTIIVSNYNSLNLSLCAKLSTHIRDCRIIGAPDPSSKYLANQSEFGLILEVGPVANGVVSAVALESTLALVESILTELSTENMQTNGSLEIYEETLDVHYPKNEKGELNGYIHSELQGKDFQPLSGTFVPFRTFQNQEIVMGLEEKLFPIFINEAAYYPQNLAFTLCRKKTLNY